MILSILFLIISIGCYSISQLQQHGKLKWMQNDKLLRGFWDDDSYLRKYKLTDRSTVTSAPDNWYYRFFKIKYKERFPLSATLLVALTDGYHACQALMFLFLSLSVAALNFSWWLLLGVWSLIHLTHFLLYKLLSK